MIILKKASIRTKLSIALGAALALVVAVGLFDMLQLQYVNAATRDIRSVWLPKIQTLDSLKRAAAEHSILAAGRAQTTNFRRIAALTKRLERTETTLRNAEQALQRMPNSEIEKAWLAQFRQLWDDYETAFRAALQRIDIGEPAAAQVDFDKYALQAAHDADEKLEQSIEFAKQHLVSASASADDAFRFASWLTIGAIFAGVILSLGVIAWTSRNVTSPILRVSEAMHRLAVGDHSAAMEDPHRHNDEIGVLIDAVSGYRTSLIRSNQLAADVAAERGRLHSAVSNMPIGLCMFDADQRLIICNAAYADIYHLPPALTRAGTALRDILRHRMIGKVAGSGLDRYIGDLASGILSGKPSRDVIELDDGRTLSIINHPMPGGGGLGIHEDITDLRRAEAQIRHMARHDALTDLPNRVLFKESLEEALKRIRRDEKIAVLSLDLDHFKSVNDTLGHPIGDLLLKAVADRLRKSLRENDAVARFGGDEFSVAQVGVEQPHAATILAQRLLDELGAPYDVGGHQTVVGVSIGIAVAPADGTDPEQLLKNADMALYRAKFDGRGVYRFFEPEMDARMQARRNLELDLRRALIQQEFELYYQPIVELKTNAITAFEALLRWHHPQRGILLPSEFVPLAEEIGLIIPLGEWVLRQACRDAAKWRNDIGVAVNLSAVQFKSKKVLEAVLSALAISHLAPRRLELEITESVLIGDHEATLATLHQLRALGVKIAMDDFGTGYSSLSYLRSFPFDKIKIDSSFIRKVNDENSSLAIVRAITGLSTSLGMGTTAEGVETEEQLARVRAEGCGEVQGFLISRPCPVKDVAALLNQYSPKATTAA